MPRRTLQGSLVTYQNGSEIGRERYRDDGHALHSDVRLGEQSFALDLVPPEPSGLPGKARVEAAGRVVERPLPPGTIVLETGAWQAYALAARAYIDATDPAPVRVLLPAQDEVLEGSIQVTHLEGGAEQLELRVGHIFVAAEIAADGAVRRVSVPAQGIEVVPEGEEAPPPSRPQASLNPRPPGVLEEPFELTRDDVVLHGSLWIPSNPPRAAMPLPLVVVVPGAGPVDRDGNDAYGLRTDAYRQLAGAVSKQDVAVLRYDKRGVGQSVLRSPDVEITFESLVTDLSAIVSAMRADERFGRVVLAGHSEGGLVALMLANAVDVAAVLVAACPGRPMHLVIHDQLARLYDREALAAGDRILDRLRAGERVDGVPAELEPVLGPTAQPYLRSLLSIDPAAIIRGVRAFTVVAQGDLDVQVSMDDAARLVDARPGAKLIRLPCMNHMLKDQTRLVPEAAYTDPRVPLARGLVDTVVALTRP